MNNEVKTVKKALDLSIKISETQDKLDSLYKDKFRAKPQPPTHSTVNISYPPIEPGTKFWSPALLPALICWPWIIIYYFTTYKKKKEADIEAIRNSEEYRQKCAKIDEEAKNKQKSIDEEYQKELHKYNTVTLPEYNKALDEWTIKHNKDIADTQATIKTDTANLEEHYATTKLIPFQYRDIVALKYIYNMISTSDYSIKEAIESYDKDRQRLLEEEKLYEQQQANQLAYEQNQNSRPCKEGRAQRRHCWHNTKT